MIEIRNLSRNYGCRTAVDDVSATIERGEIVGLLGHNGAGKTTMMKMLTGFLEPSAGTIRVAGVDPGADPIAVQRRIGYLPENAPVYPEMIVQEYLAMMAELRGVAPDRVRDAVVGAARATGILDRLLAPIASLSKGLRQRVGIAQAIVHGPDVLILDEPTNGLDPVQIQHIRDLILRLGESTTILLSTHILQEIEAVCDRVLVLIDGKLARDASLDTLTGARALRVCLSSHDDDAGPRLAELDGVDRCEDVGPDPQLPGSTRFLLYGEAPFPTAEVLTLARNHGWCVDAITPHTRSLETVYRELQSSHAARAQEVAA